MGSKVYSVRVTDDLAKDIDKRCAEQGTSAAEMLRKLVDGYMYPDIQNKKHPQEETLLTTESMKDNAKEKEAMRRLSLVQIPPPSPSYRPDSEI